MYSVLIMNQKTLDSFIQYRPLFFEAINDGSIGICKWNENGTNIDNAIPEIRSLTDDKNEWRAIIVRAFIEDEANCQSDPINPYDYLSNKEYSEQLQDSDIPLIRLTQFLGGIPPLEVQFETKLIEEEHKAPKMIYVPVENAERESKYNEFASRYKFDGRSPSSIICISLRIKPEVNIVDSAWRDKKQINEHASSDFWRRNHYPSVCRFMVYDLIEEGPVQYEADMYDFWISIALIAANEMDSNIIQAYRLYTVKSVLDLDEMAAHFQLFADRMNYIRSETYKSITAEQEMRLKEDPQLPNFQMKAPVKVSFPKTDDYKVNNKSFKFFSTGPNDDIANWERQKKESEEKLVKTMKVVERALDQTAVRTRPYKLVDETKVEVLNPYQTEDMNNEVNGMFDHIIAAQSVLPDVDLVNSKRIQEKAEKVRENLKGRTMKQPVVLVLVSVFVFIVLSIIPGIVDYYQNKSDNLLFGLISVLITMTIVFIFALTVLLIQRIKLSMLIGNYNNQLSFAFGRLVNCADDYSKYMGDILSHSRGKTYVAFSEHMIMATDKKEDSKYKHLKAINLIVSKLRAVSKAYGIDISFDSNVKFRELYIDYNTEPDKNKIYAFESEDDNSVELNSSGQYLSSPFSFVKGVNINREELYG